MLCSLRCLKARLRLLCSKLSTTQQHEPCFTTDKVMQHFYFPSGVLVYSQGFLLIPELTVVFYVIRNLDVDGDLKLQYKRLCEGCSRD